MHHHLFLETFYSPSLEDPKLSQPKMSSSHHSRSHSMPSELHPVVLRIEEELHRLDLPGAPTRPPITSSTTKTVCTALEGLQRLHRRVEDLLGLPLAQQTFAGHRHEKWVAEELDVSIRLLDLSGTARDLLSSMKEQVRDLQSVLRRRGDHEIGKCIGAYLQSRRKAQGDINKCLAALKGIDARSASAAHLELNNELSILVRLLARVRAATVTLIGSILSLVTMARSQARPSKWSLVSRATRKGRKDVKPDDVHEVESAGAVLSAFCRRVSHKDANVEEMAGVQKQLEMMEAGIVGVLSGLECLFRQLMQNRVSLLNILSP